MPNPARGERRLFYLSLLGAVGFALPAPLLAEQPVDGVMAVVTAAEPYDLRLKIARSLDESYDEVWAFVVCRERKELPTLRVQIVEDYEPIYDRKIKVAESADRRYDRKICLLP